MYKSVVIAQLFLSLYVYANTNQTNSSGTLGYEVSTTSSQLQPYQQNTTRVPVSSTVSAATTSAVIYTLPSQVSSSSTNGATTSLNPIYTTAPISSTTTRAGTTIHTTPVSSTLIIPTSSLPTTVASVATSVSTTTAAAPTTSTAAVSSSSVSAVQTSTRVSTSSANIIYTTPAVSSLSSSTLVSTSNTNLVYTTPAVSTRASTYASSSNYETKKSTTTSRAAGTTTIVYTSVPPLPPTPPPATSASVAKTIAPTSTHVTQKYGQGGGLSVYPRSTSSSISPPQPTPYKSPIGFPNGEPQLPAFVPGERPSMPAEPSVGGSGTHMLNALPAPLAGFTQIKTPTVPPTEAPGVNSPQPLPPPQNAKSPIPESGTGPLLLNTTDYYATSDGEVSYNGKSAFVMITAAAASILLSI